VRWNGTPVPNTPAKITWELVPPRPVAGEPFDIVIHWSDAEASYPTGVSWCMPESSAHGTGGLCADGFGPPFCEAHGVWNLTSPHGGSGDARFTRTLPAGTYRFDWGVALSSIDPKSSLPCQPDPYPDHAFVSDRFVVAVP